MYKVTGRKIVRPVDYQVVAGENVHHIARSQPHVVGDDVDVGVEAGDGFFGRVDLAFTDTLEVVQYLALEV